MGTLLTTAAAIATNPGVTDLRSALLARGGGPERDDPTARVSDVGPRRITLRIYWDVQRSYPKRKRGQTFRIATPLKTLLPIMMPSLYRTEQYLGWVSAGWFGLRSRVTISGIPDRSKPTA